MLMYWFCILMLTDPIKIKIHLIQDKALCVSGKPAVKANPVPFMANMKLNLHNAKTS